MISVKSIKLSLIIPVKDDLKSVTVLINQLKEVFSKEKVRLKVLIVDDSSVMPIKQKNFEKSLDVEIIRNPYNQGHQRSIINGLVALSKFPLDGYIGILDGDGEDCPEHLLLMLKKLSQDQSKTGVIAIRGVRYSGILFSNLYRLFRLVFLILIGKKFGSGNFMMFRASLIREILSIPNNHLSLAASSIRYVGNLSYMRLDRGRRIAGDSKMNLTKLLDHAFSIFAVFADIILLRILFFNTIFMLGISVGLATLLVLRSLDRFELVAGLTTSLLLQFTTFAFFFLNFALFALTSILVLKRIEEK